MTSDPNIGVVLLNHNGRRFLNGCVESLEATRYPRLQIVIVDNASTDGSAAGVRRDHSHVTVLPQASNRGFAEGMNIGIRHLLEQGCDYILLLNNDTVVDAGLPAALVAAADGSTLVAPKSYDWEGRVVNSHAGEVDWLRGRLRERFFGRADEQDTMRRQEVELADGACLLVPAGAFRRVGLFDAAYFLYYEDWDFVVRARRLGYRVVFDPAATLRHYERGTSGAADTSPVTAYYTTRNRLRFMRKHAPSAAAYSAFLVYFSVTRAITMLDCARRGQWHLAGWMLRGIADFVRGRTGAGPMHAPRAAPAAAGAEPAAHDTRG